MTTKVNKLRSAQRQQKVAEARLATVRANLEAKAMEQTQRLLESPQPVVVPWSEYPAFDDFSRWPSAYERPYLWTELDDRMEGRYLPLYMDENDLRRMRAGARKARSLFTIAEGALESLTNYVIGPGFQFTAQEATPSGKELAAKVQEVMARFLAFNDFTGVLDREIHEESRTDGECFVALYDDGENIRAELVDPDSVVEPAEPEPLNRMVGTSHKLNAWHHGVHTVWNQKLKRDDVCRPLGYHAVFDREGYQWDYIPEARCEHIKRNVGRKGRRGVSDYEMILQDLENEYKIRRNTAVGSAILAAIVMIRRHAPGVQKNTIESMVSGNSTTDYTERTKSGSRTKYSEHTPPGTVKDIPNGMEPMLGPMGTLRSNLYLEVAQYLSRIIGVRWNMPEYIISGDASNANYSSTLVAANSFVKSREADQGFYGRHFLRIVWKALKMYHDKGAFGNVTWTQLAANVAIKVDPPSVATKDELQQAQVNEILHRNRIISKQTWASDAGFNYEEEQIEMRSEPQPEPDPLGQFTMEQRRVRDLTFSLLESDKYMAENCGTGDGGFKAGNKCQKDGGGSMEFSTQKATKVDASELEFTEFEQDPKKVEAIKNTIEETGEVHPIVSINDGKTRSVIDGHHRATALQELGMKAPVVDVTKEEFDQLTEQGYEPIEIAYGALIRADEEMAANEIANQFQGSNIISRGEEVYNLLP